MLAPLLSFAILVEFLPFRSLLNDSLNDFLNDFLLEIGVSPAVDKSKYKYIKQKQKLLYYMTHGIRLICATKTIIYIKYRQRIDTDLLTSKIH